MPFHGLGTVPLQGSFLDDLGEALNDAAVEAVDYLPVVVGALLVLVVGYIIGRVLGGIVTRVIRGIGLGRFMSGSAVEEVARSDSIARSLGKLVSYYVYFVAVVAAANVLDIDALSTLLGDIAAFLPVILGALVVLVIGFVVARIVGDMVAGVVGGFGFSTLLRETPLERFADSTGEFGELIGRLVTYYIYLLTLLAVADILAIETLSTLLNTFSGHIPALAGGLVVLLVGIWVAERVGMLISESDESRLAHIAGLAVKIFIYYITITVALSTVGFDTRVLTNLFTAFTVAFFGALALALAIGIGIAVGFGGQDYVSENIDSWVRSVRTASALDSAEESED
jgi:hypothetical protein